MPGFVSHLEVIWEDPVVARWWSRLLRKGTSPSGAADLIDLYREMDVRPALPAIDVPSLVIHRAGDRLVRAEHGRYLAEHIPGARYVELSGEDHLWGVGDEDALLDEVEEFLVGTRRGSEPERALATVLFTDVVGSTERAAELGDRAWRETLERHDAAVRHQLGLHRGREVKTMGDGFLATFDGPARAIRCARALQNEVARLGPAKSSFPAPSASSWSAPTSSSPTAAPRRSRAPRANGGCSRFRARVEPEDFAL